MDKLSLEYEKLMGGILMEKIKKIMLKNFKAYKETTDIDLSNVNILMGANSSGKSSCIQSILALKQTCESNQDQIGLLLTGKYASLGAFKDILNAQSEKDNTFSLGMVIESGSDEEAYEQLNIQWDFQHNDKLINGVELKGLEISSTKNTIKIEIKQNNQYALKIDRKNTDFTIIMKNMFFDKIVVPYEKQYNSDLASYLKETIDWALAGKKHTIIIDRDKYVYNQLDNISNTLFRYYDELTKSKEAGKLEENNGDNIGKLIKKIEQKIDLQSFNRMKRNNSEINYSQFAMILTLIVFYNDVNLDDFNQIWEKYKDIKPEDEKKDIGFSEMTLDKFLDRYKRYKEQFVLNLMDSYNCQIKNVISNIRYLGPLRETPKSLYHWDIDIDPNYVGPRGEYFPSVLSILDKKEIKTILPDENEIEIVEFYDALYCWCQYLNVASEIHVNSEYSFGMNIKVQNINATEADIMNVGVGTSQVLPVLIMGLISPSNAIIIYEQPELHLHPYSQSRLADFFVAMEKMGKQFIIETHSEYMLHRMRYNLLKKKITPDRINVNFFENTEEGTKVTKGILDNHGGIDYPKDFVDQNQSLFMEMLKWGEN